MRTDAEQAELEHLEQPTGAGPDDDGFGGDGSFGSAVGSLAQVRLSQIQGGGTAL
jgi:hypothetical protein